MLTFFRKYQKIIFVFTTAVIIASFSFFGTMGSMGGAAPVEEKLLVKAIDGSSISLQKVDRMSLFLGTSLLDLKDDRISYVNVLNDGVLEKDFLETSLGSELAEKIFPEMKTEVEAVLERAFSFRSYRHAFAPFISAESAFAQFSPESTKLSSELMMRRQVVDLRQFTLLSKLYLTHQTVPSRFIKKILSYQEEQSSKGQQDPALAYADVSLLGLHSAKEWLGETYIRGVSQFILNASAFAKRQGLKVSFQEAREELMGNLNQAIQMTGSDLSQSLYQTFLLQVRRLGMTELECLDLWRDIALFRKVFAASENSVTVDPQALEELQKTGKKQALIETFSLPSALQIKDFSSLLKLQVYVEAVSKEKTTSLVLPTEFCSLSEIEKRAPDLVQKEYTLEYAEIDLKKAALQVSLKETWNWETGDFGWALLKKQFPKLGKTEAKTKEERFSFLEKLEGKERQEIDRFSREQILATDLSKIKKILQTSSLETRSFSLSAQGSELPFKGIQNSKALMVFLENSPLKGENTQDPVALTALEKLSFYTDDNQHYYFISVVERSQTKRVLTFGEANSTGTLRRMLEKKLELAYSEIRKKDSLPYLQKDGSWKPLSEVKDKIGLLAFASRLKAVNVEYSKLYGKEPTAEQKESPDFYVQNWMLSHMRHVHSLVKAGALEKKEGDLEKQWDLVQEKKVAEKTDQTFFKTSDSFEIPEGGWSDVVTMNLGKACFFKMLEKVNGTVLTSEIEALKAPLKEEAKKQLFDQIFQEIVIKKAISLKGFS